jgi:guanine nucleotide-binding protein G(i) subunit alpha
LQKDADIVLAHCQIEANHELLPTAVGKAMCALWHDHGVQTCFLRSREYQLNDSAA